MAVHGKQRGAATAAGPRSLLCTQRFVWPTGQPQSKGPHLSHVCHTKAWVGLLDALRAGRIGDRDKEDLASGQCAGWAQMTEA